MAEITAATVKELRERTGAGMMDCKKALGETNGDMEAAIDWLRTKGLAAAAKKAGRTAAEGLVGVAVDGNKGAMVEVNSRDRLRRQERAVPGFRPHRRRDRARHRQRHRGAEGGLLAGRRHRRGEADRQHRHDRREPVAPPRRLARGRARASIVSYVHNAAAPGLGKIGVLVALESDGDKAALEALGKQLAMHIAAANPLALRGEELDPGAGRARARDRRRRRRPRPASPPRSSRKMVEGAMAKFRKENALLSQLFVIDNKTKVEDVVAADGQGGRRADRAQGLCPLPARRGHREEGKRLRRRSRRRGRAPRSPNRSPEASRLAGWRAPIKVRAARSLASGRSTVTGAPCRARASTASC